MANPNNYEYNFEIETILTQFVSTIDGAIVMRYNKNSETGERSLDSTIKPQYIFGTKTRAILDRVNKAKNYTLPAVLINISSIQLDKERLQSKHTQIIHSSDQILYAYSRPTPITISAKCTILVKFISDLYQIGAKLMTQFQPYVTYSWYVPHNNIKKSEFEELKNKIEWDGSFNITKNETLRETDEEIFKGEANFTIDGWLFPNMKDQFCNVIYDIGTTTLVESDLLGRIEGGIPIHNPLVDYITEHGDIDFYKNPREFANGHPRIVNVFQTVASDTKPVYFRVDKDRNYPLNFSRKTQLTLDGYNFNYVKAMLVPTEHYRRKIKGTEVSENYKNANLFPNRDTISKKESIITGYELPIINQTQNHVTIGFDGIEFSGNFDVVIYDNIDYDSVLDCIGAPLTSKSTSK